jgi:hypothetical protein
MVKVRYGQRGYSGFSRSARAVEAEREGKLPMSRAIPVTARLASCSRTEARRALEAVGPREWHHTSKYANATDYYMPEVAAHWLYAEKLLAAVDWRDRFEDLYCIRHGQESYAERDARMRDGEAAFVAETGLPFGLCVTAYYATWNEDWESGQSYAAECQWVELFRV